MEKLISGADHRDGAETGEGISVNDARLMLIAVLITCAIIFIRNAGMVDDSFVDGRVVDNFVHGYGLRWNIDERVQVFTSPLWTLLLTIPYFFTGEFYYTTLALSVALSVFTVLLLLTRFRSGIPCILLTLGLVLVSKAYVVHTMRFGILPADSLGAVFAALLRISLSQYLLREGAHRNSNI